jgi:hypothetical protein
MATDYDAPRRDEVDLGEDSLEELKSRRVDAQSGSVDVDEGDVADSFELPGADLADEELTVRLEMFPRTSPQPTGVRAQRRSHLPRMRLTDRPRPPVSAGERPNGFFPRWYG